MKALDACFLLEQCLQRWCDQLACATESVDLIIKLGASGCVDVAGVLLSVGLDPLVGIYGCVDFDGMLVSVGSTLWWACVGILISMAFWSLQGSSLQWRARVFSLPDS